MKARAEIHALFVQDFEWSTGRANLLADMMTEHQEMLTDAFHYSRKNIEQGLQRFSDRFNQLLNNAKFLSCVAFEVAEESAAKKARIARIVTAREERLFRNVAGRVLP